MKTTIHLWVLGTLALFTFCRSANGADQITLQLNPRGMQSELGLHSRLALPVSALYPEYLIQQSTNLVDWTTVTGPIAGNVGVSDEWLNIAVPSMESRAFYRAVANVKLAPAGTSLGDSIYGYGTAFGQEIQRVGQLSPDGFVAMYGPTNHYLPQITFDPTAGDFWNLFNMDPTVWNATNSYQNWRLTDFRLNPQEFAVFQTNGFVVSQRMERKSFADVYYDLYTDELPVFVTTDSILQAWHRTFLTMLAEIEETGFQPDLSSLLASMSAQIPNLWSQAQGTAMQNGVLDADYFLAVARSLDSGVTDSGSLGQSARITATLTAINNQQPVKFNLFGEARDVDFSQFTVRGHYVNSVALSRYFRAMMWCSLADYRYAGFASGSDLGDTNTLRELSGAVALDLALRNSGSFSNWIQFNRTLELFVGTPDSLTFAQLDGLLQAAKIHSPADLASQSALTNLQNQLMTGQLGLQQISSGYYYSPFSAEQVKLPRSFAFMGQRFAMDSWALGKCTFDNIIWNDDGIPDVTDKVLRRVPSALDIDFAVFGNSQVVPEITARIVRTNLTPADGRVYWRDGLKYQHNLAAVRKVIDRQNSAAWTNSIFNHWLACLRELSQPTTDLKYPQAMRTRAWAMKTVNTQLASWTQLRYTTMLYAKESYTPILLCSYPDGYVEPVPAFWSRMRTMALATRAVLATLPTNGIYTYTHSTNDAYGMPVYFDVSVTGATMCSNRLAVLDRFANALATLAGISEKELAKTALATNEIEFLKDLVEFNYAGERTYGGWYPQLFYQPGSEYVPPNFDSQVSGDNQGSDFWDALVTTVHTDSPNLLVGDPGSILNEGIGNVQLLMIAVDSGPGDLAVYAGPVLSHYEFETGPTTRLTDDQWKAEVTNDTLPPAPDWTQSYLVPKP
jgi:hypothetical protein